MNVEDTNTNSFVRGGGHCCKEDFASGEKAPRNTSRRRIRVCTSGDILSRNACAELGLTTEFIVTNDFLGAFM